MTCRIDGMRWTMAAAALTAFAPVVARAQTATTAATPAAQAAKEQAAVQAQAAAQVQLDGEIERLVRALAESQRREQELARQFFASETDSARDARPRTPVAGEGMPEAVRGEIERRRKLMIALREASSEVMRTQAHLAAMCDRTPRPDGWLGISFESDARVVRRADGTTGLRFVSYPTVAAIEPNSPAAEAGVLRGDTLVMLGTVELKERDVNFTSLLRPGVRLPVTVKRDGDSRVFVVKITRRPESFGDRCTLLDRQMSAVMANPVLLPGGERRLLVRTPAPPMAARAPGATRGPVAVVAPEAPQPPRAREPNFGYTFVSGDWFGGAELRRLNRDLADLTGADEGVFIVSVAPGSPSNAAGLKGGDVIVRVDEMNLTQPRDLFRALRESAMRDGDDRSVQLTVVRKKKRQVLVMKLGHR